jgi:hypothetical protein
MDFTDKSVRTLANSSDNLPFLSLDRTQIVFTRKMNATSFGICTIRPGGTGPKVLATSEANDARAV